MFSFSHFPPFSWCLLTPSPPPFSYWSPPPPHREVSEKKRSHEEEEGSRRRRGRKKRRSSEGLVLDLTGEEEEEEEAEVGAEREDLLDKRFNDGGPGGSRLVAEGEPVRSFRQAAKIAGP